MSRSVEKSDKANGAEVSRLSGELKDKLGTLRVRSAFVGLHAPAITRLKSGGDPLSNFERDSIEVLLEEIEDTLAEVRSTKEELDKLVSSESKGKPTSMEEHDYEWEIKHAEIACEKLRISLARSSLLKTTKELAVREKAVQIKLDNLAASKSAAYLELMILGTTPHYDFVLREFDANGKEIGTAVFDMKNAQMLAKILARTRADTTAPREVRVLASPPTALGGGTLTALKALDAAGYRSLKFTGYVVAGGFAQELKIGDKGVRPGYAWYDGVERKVTELMKEIEDGMRTF